MVRSPLTVAELLDHPLFGRTSLELEPRDRGKVAVAQNRGGPLFISYEIHGNGPRHLVV